MCGARSYGASPTYMTFTPIIINALLSGKALTNEVSVAASAGKNSSLLPVALAVVPYTLASVASFLVRGRAGCSAAARARPT